MGSALTRPKYSAARVFVSVIGCIDASCGLGLMLLLLKGSATLKTIFLFSLDSTGTLYVGSDYQIHCLTGVSYFHKIRENTGKAGKNPL